MANDFEKALTEIPSNETYNDCVAYSGVLMGWFDRNKEAIRTALQQAQKIESGELFLCERKSHVPDHDGGTGYFYYQPIAAPDETKG